jgi:hypothetical protein
MAEYRKNMVKKCFGKTLKHCYKAPFLYTLQHTAKVTIVAMQCTSKKIITQAFAFFLHPNFKLSAQLIETMCLYK